MNNGKINSLTSIRFFAALIVVLFHFGGEINYPTGMKQLSGLGPAGVSFFFILSGFILTLTYGKKFKLRLSLEGIKAFYIARIARVYPVHALTLLICTPLAIWYLYRVDSNILNHPLALVFSWFTNLFLVNIYFVDPGFVHQWNAPSWSIACEAVFYIFAPLIISRVIKTKRPGIYISVCYCTSLALAYLLSFLIKHNHYLSSLNIHDSIRFVMMTSPIFRVWDFILGCLLCKYIISKDKISINNVILAIAFGLIFIVMASRVLPISREISSIPGIVFYVGQLGLFFSIPFCLIIAAAYLGGTILDKILNLPIFVLLGESSYSLYLIHWSVLILFNIIHTYGIPHNNFLGVVGMLFSIGASILSFKFFEEPARNLMKNSYSKKPAQKKYIRS